MGQGTTPRRRDLDKRQIVGAARWHVQVGLEPRTAGVLAYDIDPPLRFGQPAREAGIRGKGVGSPNARRPPRALGQENRRTFMLSVVGEVEFGRSAG